MRRTLLTLAIAAFAGLAAASAAAPAAASPRDDVMALVHKFEDAFNKGDAAAAAATCVDDMSIIDEFPPYEWHGPGTLMKWLADYGADAKKNGITDGAIAMQKPRHVMIEGDRAYVVAPTNYTYKKHGKKVKQVGSTFVIALRNGEGGWRVTGWSWGTK